MCVCVCVHIHAYIYAVLPISIHPCIHMSQGVVYQTIMSSVWAQGASLQTTEKTTNEAFLNILFSNSGLQKMFIQFTP